MARLSAEAVDAAPRRRGVADAQAPSTRTAEQPVSQRELEDAYLTNALVDAYDDDPEFGYRLLADELERAGHVVGEALLRAQPPDAPLPPGA